MTMPTTARRALLGAGAALPFAAPGLVHAQAGPPIRYPDPAIKVLDPRFEPLVVAMAAIERIAGDAASPRGRSGSVTSASSCSVIFRTTG